MSELKHDCRQSPRRRVLKNAHIIFNNRRSSIDCVVRNLSAHGALLLLPTVVGVPNDFDLCIDGETTCHLAHVVWKGKDRLGVSWA
ncbi:MAG: PilZ domain-containing protein [Methyloceanibacter sp.]|nr:PilZ domain-containing protein [Methyloceanibacter sp.]